MEAARPAAGSVPAQAPSSPARRRPDPWLLALLPALLVLLPAFGLPLAELVSVSLRFSAGPAQVGDDLTLANYTAFATDPLAIGILLRTVWLGLMVVAGCLLVGYPAAYLLARSRARWRGPVLLAVAACMMVSSVVRNLGWFPILGEAGLVNRVLLATGVADAPVPLVGNTLGVVVGLVHTQLPIMVLTLTAVIARIEPDLEEAAQGLGCGPLETFGRVVLPLSLPGVVAGSLLAFTLSISAFTTPAILGGNALLIMATYIAQQFQTVLDYPKGASAALLMMAAVALLTLAALRVRLRGEAAR